MAMGRRKRDRQEPLFITAQEWNGPEGIFNEQRTGQVLAVDAPAPHAGHP